MNSFMEKRSSFNGDLGHLLDLSGQQNGGIAYVDVLCSNAFNIGYSDINASYGSVPTYSWTVNVVTHELGHNLGSHHTHDCVWGPDNCTAIDGCAEPKSSTGCGSCAEAPIPSKGTIMSYCHRGGNGIDFNLGFGPEPGDVIRAKVAASPCLTACGTGGGGCTLVIEDLVVQDATCGEDNGKLTVEVTGASGGATYDIGNGPQSSNVFSDLAAGTYQILVRSGSSCQRDESITIAQLSDKPALDATVTNANCGKDDGIIELEANGGAGNYSYRIGSKSQSTPVFHNLAVGNYTAMVTDNGGCEVRKQLAVFSDNPPQLSVSVQHTSCGHNNGEVSLSTEGGSTPYIYKMGEQSSNNGHFAQMPAGNYTVQVVDANGCQDNHEVRIEDSREIGATAITSATTCGLENGHIEVHASGGTGMLQYGLGAAFQAENRFSDVAAGSYRLKITDEAGCTLEIDAEIPGSQSLALIPEIEHPTCGMANGKVVLEAVGNTGPYSYRLGAAAFGSNQEFRNLSDGTTTIAVRDTAGCVVEEVIEIEGSTKPKLSASVTPTRCGLSNGRAVMHVDGGKAPYLYIFNRDTFFHPQIAGLTAGTYPLKVQDVLGCSDSTTIVIDTSSRPRLAVQSQPASCYQANGTILVQGSEGTGSYLFSIDHQFQSETHFQDLDSGIYRVVLQDQALCYDTVEVRVAYNDQYQRPVLRETIPICGLDPVTLDAGLVDPPDIKWWFNGAILDEKYPVLITDQPGTYRISANYHKDCVLEAVTQLEAREKPTQELVVSDTICLGETFRLNNIDKAYSYIWSNDLDGPAVKFTTSGRYQLKVVNEHGCSITEDVDVHVIPPVSLTTVEDTPFICHGDKWQWQVQGGQSYQWFTADTTIDNSYIGNPVVHPVTPQSYQVVGSNQCFADTLNLQLDLYQNVVSLPADTLVIEGSPLLLFMDSNAVATHWTAPYPLDCFDCLSTLIRPDVPGHISVRYVDINGCEWDDDFEVDIIPLEAVFPTLVNVITPNEDGRNDALAFDGLEHFKDISITVFNQDGNVLYTSRDYKNDWKGTMKGEPLPEGVYYYMITLIRDDRLFQFDSDLTIVRD